MRALAVLVLYLCATALMTEARYPRHSLRHSVAAPQANSVTVELDASTTKFEVASTLWGIFFEEINHAGVGGLEGGLLNQPTFAGGLQSWTGSSATVALDKQTIALSALNQSVKVTTSAANAQLSNSGYWGIPTTAGESFSFSGFFLVASGSTPVTLTAQLQSTSKTVYGSKALGTIAADGKWHQVEATITVDTADTSAAFAIVSTEANVVYNAQLLTLYSDSQGFAGLSFLRKDLAQMIADIKPSFMRFPGGCYVEGNDLTGAFNWKNSIGPLETRPGHQDQVWGYWSPDHLGYLEFLQFSEAIGAEPLFVVNNGQSHSQSLPPNQVDYYIQLAMDAVEFANGDTSTTYGALRAQYGHAEPFNLKYMAIGNEDAGKTYYWPDYEIFVGNLSAKYPYLEFVANDNPAPKYPSSIADFYDYHFYSSPSDFYTHSTAFDNQDRAGSKVFVSEYAVTSQYGTKGNFQAALAEAAFLTGCERNSDIVALVSYAPLLVNDNNRAWSPDSIVFNASQSFGTPSYYLMTMFFPNTGDSALPFNLTVTSGINFYLSPTYSTTDTGADEILLKMVSNNAADITVHVQVTLKTGHKLATSATLVSMSAALTAENSFAAPTNVVPKTTTVTLVVTNNAFDITLAGYSANVLVVSAQ